MVDLIQCTDNAQTKIYNMAYAATETFNLHVNAVIKEVSAQLYQQFSDQRLIMSSSTGSAQDIPKLLSKHGSWWTPVTNEFKNQLLSSASQEPKPPTELLNLIIMSS